MATELPGASKHTGIAGVDLSEKRYHIAKIATTGLIGLCGAGGAGIGIISEPEDIGNEVGYVSSGEYPVIYGAGVTAGDPLASDASGKAVTAVAGDHVIGIAKETGVANEIRTILLLTMGPGSFPSGARGSILVHNGTNWIAFPAGTANLPFVTKGAGQDPIYSALKGGSMICFSMDLADIPVGGGDLLTSLPVDFPGKVTSIRAIANKAGTGVGATFAITGKINAVSVTGQTLTITLANMGTLGAVVSGVGTIGANTFVAGDTISLVAAAGTVFSAGKVTFIVELQPTVTA